MTGHCCGCSFHSNQLAVIADGVDAVRKAVREELRRGASHIKIMASGGVASPTDPIDRCQYSEEEIRAAVEEADRAGQLYCGSLPSERSRPPGCRVWACARSSMPPLIDQPTADFVAEKGAFAVPTLAIMVGLLEEGEQLGLPAASMEKLKRFGDAAFLEP